MHASSEKAELMLRRAMEANSRLFYTTASLVWVGAYDKQHHNLYGMYRSITPEELIGREYRVGMMSDHPSVIWADSYFDFKSRKFIRY